MVLHSTLLDRLCSRFRVLVYTLRSVLCTHDSASRRTPRHRGCRWKEYARNTCRMYVHNVEIIQYKIPISMLCIRNEAGGASHRTPRRRGCRWAAPRRRPGGGSPRRARPRFSTARCMYVMLFYVCFVLLCVLVSLYLFICCYLLHGTLDLGRAEGGVPQALGSPPVWRSRAKYNICCYIAKRSERAAGTCSSNAFKFRSWWPGNRLLEVYPGRWCRS